MSTAETSPSMRRIGVRLFAAARERAGHDIVEITIPKDATIHEARRCLGNEVPALADQAPTLLFAIGTEYAHNNDVIPDDCELAAFPPVSGG